MVDDSNFYDCQIRADIFLTFFKYLPASTCSKSFGWCIDDALSVIEDLLQLFSTGNEVN